MTTNARGWPAHWPREFRAGAETTLHGLATSIGPILIFVGFFGTQALSVAFWATLMTAVLASGFALLLKGNPSIIPSTRAASLTVYAGLILQLSMAGSSPSSHAGFPDGAQLMLGVASASLLFALASLLIFLAGVFRLGNVFKMIPSTVTAGISNSTALLLVWLAIKQIYGEDWRAGVIAAAMGLSFWAWSVLQRRASALKAVPNVLIAAGVGLTAVALLQPLGVGANTMPAHDNLAWVNATHWASLGQQPRLTALLVSGLPGAITLTVIMILETFTAISVMESRFGLRVDANRELMVMGGANLVSAMVGGVPSTGSPLRCLMNWLAGGRGALAALVGLILTGLAIVLLSDWLLIIPAGVVAGLFLIQAPVMVDPSFQEQLRDKLRKRGLHRDDAADLGFWITLVITLAGIFGNLIWACFLGVGLSAMAVLRRVSGSLTSRWAYLDQFRSRRVRSLEEISYLEQVVYQVGILQLTGHLFFGNSSRLMQLADELRPEVKVVVVDISQVHDADPSGLNALKWLIRALSDRHLKVILTGQSLTHSMDLKLTLAGLPGVTRDLDLDRGLEGAEELVLQRSTVVPVKLNSVKADDNLLLHGMDLASLQIVLQLGCLRELKAGEVLFRQATVPDGVWLLEVGQVSILSGQGDAARLATFGPGQFVGEMGFVDGKPRSATARADTPLRALFLGMDSLAVLAAQRPDAALKIAQNIARELSHRMRNSAAHLQGTTEQENSGWANSELLSTLTRF